MGIMNVQTPRHVEAHNGTNIFHLSHQQFWSKYIGRKHVDHLIACIKKKYELTKDWIGGLYCGIKLNWDYDKKTLDISMPGYIKKLLLKYKH
jgi:hypothetical protein